MRSILFASVLVGCTATSTPAAVPAARTEEGPPRVVEIPAEPAEPELPTATIERGPEIQCGTRYGIDRIDKSSPTCTVDIPDVGTEAKLDCDGTSATLHFEKRDYVGAVSGTAVELHLVSTYDFTDGCIWEATARVTGTVAGELRLDYTERAIQGSACSDACTATAVIGVR